MPEIVYEDNHLIAVNKRSSDLVQGDKTGDESLDVAVKKYIKEKYNKPGNVFAGVIHRIDRPVSGVVLYARTSKALSRMSEVFREKRIRKRYIAVVKEMPPAEKGELRHYLKKNEKQNRSYAFSDQVRGAKESLLKYYIAGRSASYYLLVVDLLTGRHHQIRSQLAAVGCPIRGDLKYGFSRSNRGGGIDLHALQLSFMHPIRNEPLTITAQPPADSAFRQIFGHIITDSVLADGPKPEEIAGY